MVGDSRVFQQRFGGTVVFMNSSIYFYANESILLE